MAAKRSRKKSKPVFKFILDEIKKTIVGSKLLLANAKKRLALYEAESKRSMVGSTNAKLVELEIMMNAEKVYIERLEQCLKDWESIDNAIVQTLTPSEYRLYLNLYVNPIDNNKIIKKLDKENLFIAKCLLSGKYADYKKIAKERIKI